MRKGQLLHASEAKGAIMSKEQLKLLGIILSMRARREPITFRKLASAYGCQPYNIQTMMQRLRADRLVDWDSGGDVKASTIRPLVRFIPVEELGECNESQNMES